MSTRRALAGDPAAPVTPPVPADVAEAFAVLPEALASRLSLVRELVFEVAATLPECGGLEEYLAWGQPSYRPLRPRVGTSVRLGVHEGERPALFVHCGTSLISDARSFAGELEFSGKRAVLLPLSGPLPDDELRAFVGMALTYHAGRSA